MGNKHRTTNQKGQVVIIFLLVIVIALAVGLSIVGRTTTEIATSTKTEDSSKAFSAAEAGLERALQQTNLPSSGGINTSDALNNQSAASVTWNNSLPRPKTALEYPPIGKDSFAQFWLADPGNLTQAYYNQGNFNLYFGSPQTTDSPLTPTPTPGGSLDNPAVEVNIITFDPSTANDPSTAKYDSHRYFFDSYNVGTVSTRIPANGFEGCGQYYSPVRTNDSTSSKLFYCKVTVNGYKTTLTAYPIMARVRLLYSSTYQPMALSPTCSNNNSTDSVVIKSCSLPPQVSIFRSKGTAGNVRRDLQVLRQKYTLPYFFDYALYSAGDLKK